jgi:tetratricopeptide (TPR) repeat protein
MLLQEREKNHWVFSVDHNTRDVEDTFEAARDAWHSGQFHIAERKFLALVEKCPNHIDALHHLSIFYDEAGLDAISYAYSQAAVGVGLRAIPAGFSWSKSRLEWSVLENRPFLRAYHGLGLWFLKHQHYRDAEQAFTRILAVCPNDNIGVRYLLPECWLAQGDFESVVKHCQAQKGDSGPDIHYSMALAMVACGNAGAAKAVLEQACAHLPLVAKELLKKRHTRPVSAIPGTLSWSGADQAYDYWQRMGKYWSASEEAMQLLCEVAMRK